MTKKGRGQQRRRVVAKSLEDLKLIIREDTATSLVEKNIRLTTNGLSVGDLLSEISEMHSKRDLRVLRHTQVIRQQRDKLIKATLQNQSFRSRSIEIKVAIIQAKEMVDEMVDTYYGYLVSTYGNQMRDLGLKTIGERDNFLREFYRFGSEWQRSIKGVLESIDLVIDDLDSAGWAIQRITKILEITEKEKWDR